MIADNTLFILGAGASSTYGYPTGNELKRLIINEFVADFHNWLYPTERIHLPNDFLIKEFAFAFDKSEDKLIDYFLHTCDNKSYVEIGKQAIALYIQKADEDYLFSRNIEYNKDDKDDWYPLLFSKLTEGAKGPNEISNRKINFITFNYDRLIEYKLLTSIKYKYGIQWNDAYKCISHIKVSHVFGAVNALSPDTYHLSNKKPFQTDYETVIQNSKAIKTIGERSSLDLDEVRNLLADASRIFFLGFGFNQENVELLDIKNNVKKNIKIFGTSVGLNENRINEVKELIDTTKFEGPVTGKKLLSAPILESLVCSDLLAKYL